MPKLDSHITYKGHRCLVWSINKAAGLAVLFNLDTRNYITVDTNKL